MAIASSLLKKLKITIEDDQMALWLWGRSYHMMSQSFNWIQVGRLSFERLHLDGSDLLRVRITALLSPLPFP
jgi:hypothetical protein